MKVIMKSLVLIKFYQMQGSNSEVCYSEHSNNHNQSEQLQKTPSLKAHNLHKSSIINQTSKPAMELSTDVTHRMPINLFHSSAEYNKMLITNGKSLQKQSQPHIEGFVDSLEFVNQSLFESNEQKIYERRRQQQATDQKKKVQSVTQQCCCCCCDNFCLVCAKNSSQKKSFMKNSSLAISQSLLDSRKKTKKNHHKKKVITSNAETKKITIDPKILDKQSSDEYLSHKTFNIDHLICKSLIQFQEKQRQHKMSKLIKEKRDAERKDLMKKLDEDIRKRNASSVSKNKSEKHLKSDLTKSKVRMDYWSSIKDKVKEQLKKNKPQSKAIDSKKYEIQCNHKPKIGDEKMKKLKIKYQKEAQEKIAKEMKQKKNKQKKINTGLKKLDKERKNIVSKCGKKSFKPSEEMIENAFSDWA